MSRSSALANLRNRLANALAVRYGAILGFVWWGCCVQLDYRRPGMATA